MRIIIDVMGGDHAPSEIIKGAVLASKKTDNEMVLVGDEDTIKDELLELNSSIERFKIIHADEVIGNEESPVKAIRNKKNSSMVKGINMLLGNPEDIFISAGSTGALFVGSRLILGRIRGIDRPALGCVYPMLGKNKYAILVDAGASSDCRAKNLVEYALMGSIYMEKVEGIENPRVGLVNIGEEKEKGNALTKQTHDLLSESDLNFAGNVEAREIPQDACDVIVCDGFTGNVIVKLTEGLGLTILGQIKKLFFSNLKNKLSALMMKKDISEMKDRFDYSEYGGAPIIGVRGAVIKMHGSSKAHAVKNAIIKGIPYGEQNVVGLIEEEITRLAEIEDDDIDFD